MKKEENTYNYLFDMFNYCCIECDMKVVFGN
jgi:hypothetical protein